MVLEIAMVPSLVFGQVDPMANDVKVYTISTPSAINWGCTYAPPKFSTHSTSYSFYAFESCN